MNLSADEFLSLSTQMSDRDVRVAELDQEQWFGAKSVLVQLCGFPVKPAEFEKVLKNLGLDQLRVPYVYDSVRKVHLSQLPQNVELWHQYLNTADEYSRKQVLVAVKLIELLEKAKG